VLKGAVGEAMTNAAKHAEAARVVVYVEPLDGGIFCSVRDDGTGFDVAATPEGVGLSRSIRGRIEQAGGTVQLDSAPGRGTEVRLTVPLDGTGRSDA
jgi:signal transduction histidine kinase